MTSDASETKATSGKDVNIDKQRVATVYAKALLSAMEPIGQSDMVLEELDALVDEVLKISPDLEAALASPRISAQEKGALLDRIFSNYLSEQTLTFLKVVADHGRLDCIRQIRRATRNELNHLRHRVSVLVTTAEPIDDALRGRIAERLQAKLNTQVDLECEVNPELIGGLVVRVGDTVFDASVANQLARLKEDTVNKTVLQLRESIDRFAVTG